MEGALTKAGHRKVDQRLAKADWDAFAKTLGPEFFVQIRDSHRADTLLSEPPRRRMNEGFNWHPEHPQPIKDTQDLFRRGVCQVRHNLAHGEKFSVTGESWDRDVALVEGSLSVLRLAGEKSGYVPKNE